MDANELILTLLKMERTWWEHGRQILERDGVDIQESMDMPFIEVVLGILQFPPMTKEQESDIYMEFDGNWEPVEMLVWLRGQKAMLECYRDLLAAGLAAPDDPNAPPAEDVPFRRAEVIAF